MNKTIACLILSISILISTGCENSSWHSEYYQKHPLVNKIWSVAENKFVTKTLGWKPSVKFDDGLKNSVEWYKNFVKLYFDKQSFFKNLL